MKTQKLIVKHDFVMAHAKTTSKKQLAYVMQNYHVI